MIDLLFSYWIFLWFFLYLFKITKYNPKLLIIIVSIFAIFNLFYLYKNTNNKTIIYKYLFEIAINKFIPLLIIWNTKISINDIYINLFIFILYLVYLFFKKTNFIKVYTNLNNSILLNKNDLPFFKLYNFIFT